MCECLERPDGTIHIDVCCADIWRAAKADVERMRPVVDLPQPDSPTSPSVFDSSTSKETPSTAWTLVPRRELSMPCSTGKYFTRSWTLSSGAIRSHPSSAP